jgi:hypothetical protein
MPTVLTRFLCVFIPHLSLKISGSAALQGSQLTLRLAIACALQDIWVALAQHLSRRPIRHAFAFGCLSSWRPLGLALGFYRTWVRRLDLAHFNCKGKLGQPSMAGALSCHAPPASSESSATWPGGFKRVACCATLRRSGLCVAFEGVGWRRHKGKEGKIRGNSLLVVYTW